MYGCGASLKRLQFLDPLVMSGSWHHTIILQPFFVLFNISSFILVFSNTSLYVDTPDPFLEDGFGERYLNRAVVVNEEGASIPLDRCDSFLIELPNHPSWIVRSHSYDARKNQKRKFVPTGCYLLWHKVLKHPLHVFFSLVIEYFRSCIPRGVNRDVADA